MHLNIMSDTIYAGERMAEINKYGLLNALINVINNEEESSPRVIIAKYFLKNFNNLHNMNIFDAEVDCNVSRATIRRFSQSIGFDNFKSLKEDKVDYEFYTPTSKQLDSKSKVDEFIRVITECDENLSHIKKELAKEMKKAKEIIFLVSDVYYTRVLEFQKEMVMQDRVVRVVSFNFSNNVLLRNTDESSLIFILSVSGGFIKKIKDYIDNLKGKKVIITSLDKDKLDNEFDYIVRLGQQSMITSKSLYHTFAIEYCLDSLLEEYRLIS